MKNLWLMLVMMLCISACSSGDDEPIESTPTPEVIKPEITIDAGIVSNGLSFNAAKGENTLSFTTNTDWSLSVAETRSGSTWCTASPTSGSKGTANVKFTTTENTEFEDRSVSVTIKAGTANKTFKITQKAADALLVTTTKYEVPKEGGQIEIEVKSNIDYQMAISKTAKEWIVESESKSRALSTHKHVLDIAANEGANKREGEITFKSGNKVETVKVYQAGEAVLLLSQSEYIVSDAGETISVDIKSNVEYDVLMPDVDWLTDESSSRGLSSHTMKFAVAANETHDSRSAEIIFSDRNSELTDTLKVVQVQKNAIVISKKEYDVNPEGETIEVELNSNVDFDISIEHDWITQVESKSSRGLVSRKLYFQVAGNDTKEERNSKINITDKNKQITEAIIIKQKSKEKNIPYLTFSANGNQTLTMTKAVETLEYSVNGGEWKELGTNTVEFGGDMGDLRLRGKNAYGTSKTLYGDYSSITFSNYSRVECSGDIRTLIDFENHNDAYTGNAKFIRLFYCCENLTTAPELPSTALAESCYSWMFYGCSNLYNAPELPATILAESCYAMMFGGCTSLKKAPLLPATNLAGHCYANMFYRCTDLTATPNLPATTLADYCYSGMFSDCENLVTTTELPVEKLATGCYNGMFSGCNNLTIVPKLPATTLAKECYSGMFANCNSLTIAPELPATELAESCYSNMFGSCTSLTVAPKLPVITLAKSCYSSMFSYCTNLKEASELPATTLAESCYYAMFVGCTNLTVAPKLSATTLAQGCYNSMFALSSISIAPDLPATTLAVSCYNNMFYSCKNLKVAPKLPAKELTKYCYYEMFDNCEKLDYVIMLATDINTTDCLTNWLNSVSQVGTFIKAKEMETSKLQEVGAIPNEWTIKDIETEQDFPANENLENPNESNTSEW